MCICWKGKVGLKSYSSRMPFKILIAISLYIWKIIACILWMHPASCCRHRENSREINSKYNLLLYVFPNKYLSIRPHLSLQCLSAKIYSSPMTGRLPPPPHVLMWPPPPRCWRQWLGLSCSHIKQIYIFIYKPMCVCKVEILRRVMQSQVQTRIKC